MLASATIHAQLTIDNEFSPLVTDIGVSPVSQITKLSDGTYLASGSFIRVNGQRVDGLIKLDAAGNPLPGFHPPFAPVAAAPTPFTVDDQGRIYVGTWFEENHHSRMAPVRLLSDGTLDPTFTPSEHHYGVPTLQGDGTLLITDANQVYRYFQDGTFDQNFRLPYAHEYALTALTGNRVLYAIPDFDHTNNGITPYMLLALKPDGTVDSSFPMRLADGWPMQAKQVDGGAILVCGFFSAIDGVPEKGLARLTADGALDLTYSAPEQWYSGSLALLDDGSVLHGTYGGTLRRLTPEGIFDPSFNTTKLGTCVVNSAAVTEKGYLVGAILNPPTSYEGTILPPAYAGTILLDRTGARIGTDSPTYDVPGSIAAIAPTSDGKLVIAGGIHAVNGATSPSIAKIDWRGNIDPTFKTGAIGAGVNALAVDPQGRIVATGGFWDFTGGHRAGVARLNADGSLDPTFSPQITERFIGNTVSVYGDKIYVAGEFSAIAGAKRLNVARLNDDGSVDPTFDPKDAACHRDGVVDPYNANWLAVLPDGKILVAGAFVQTLNGWDQTAKGLIRLNPDGSVDPTFAFPGISTDMSTACQIQSVAILADGSMVIAGDFRYIGALRTNERFNIAKIDRDGHFDPTFKAPTKWGSSVRDVAALNDGRVIADIPDIGRHGPTVLFPNGQVDESVSFPDSTMVWTHTMQLADGSLCLYGSMNHVAGLATSTIARVALPSVQTSVLSNLSLRTKLSRGQTVIAGIVSSGAQPILFRAAGPALAATFPQWFSADSVLSDPQIALHIPGSADALTTNDDWSQTALAGFTFEQLGAFPFAPDSRDSAFVASVNGAATIWIQGRGEGTTLVEAYQASASSDARLLNVSARNQVGTGSDALIAGFVVKGTGTKRVLIRGIGPTLEAFGIDHPVQDPELVVYDSTGTKLASNDNWQLELRFSFTLANAFALPDSSADAAIVASLPASPEGRAYTAVLTGKSGVRGEGLIEVYELP